MDWQAAAQLIGRVLLGVFYLAAGLSKIPRWNFNVAWMHEKGMILVPFFLVGAIFLQVVGGGLVALGYHTRLGALLILIFTIPAMFIFCDFWTVEGPTKSLIVFNFLGCLMIIAFALFIMGTGPGAFALESRLK